MNTNAVVKHITDWLKNYFKPTLELCNSVMKNKSKIGFVVRDYADYFGYNYMLTHDTKKLAEDIFGEAKTYKVKLSQMKTKRSPKKLTMGNYETLYVYEKR